MADKYLKEQKTRIEEFAKMLKTLCINDSNHLSQLQTDFDTLSNTPDNIKDMIKINKNDFSALISFAKQYSITQLLLNKKLFEIHKQNYNNSYNSDFNYLYNDDKNVNSTEIYIYDIKSHEITSTIELKSYKITNYIKISNSHLLIMGVNKNRYKGLLMELKTKTIRQTFNIKSQENAFDYFNQFIYYDDYLFVFGDLGSTGLAKYHINHNIWQKLEFPRLEGRRFFVLFHNYVLISSFKKKGLSIYDLLIESHSEFTFYSPPNVSKFLFTDQVRVYLWIQDRSIHESDVNNPFKWNLIGKGKIGFGIPYSPSDVTFSNFEGNIYASFIERPHMFCYMFNRERKKMELISKEKVNK